MTTNVIDAQATAEVAIDVAASHPLLTARTVPVGAPLVATVAAGAALLTPGAVQFLEERETEGELSAVEWHLLSFLEGRGLLPLCWDDPAYVARAISPQGGDTAEGLAQEKTDFLTARRVFAQRLRAFCAAVDADDIRRAAFASHSHE